ncbi:PREDICTED: uncharacterized protein LOC105976816 [Erythranthe guttata]|uniref:uncharacterized protein LOC105976816 n=1 Tax=Erythranthe guttata TaxID=4155 RepID=UPI00064DE730|nr:PREDICTED: uncharacterized protein LOC105976816 [Erythranthe guttata]|eukprot:XP_012857529.1 PREDICTED: uncharacterized protein LOC105976816 [Erythranthe guttata]
MVTTKSGHKPETTLYAIFGCEGVRQLWKQAPFHLSHFDDGNPFWSWLEYLEQTLAKEYFLLAVVVCWKVWEMRNRQLHGEECFKLADIIGWCSVYLQTFNEAQFRPLKPPSPNLQEVWQPPPTGTLKVNVDAAFPLGQDYYNISLVARDCTGRCIWWKVRKLMGRVRPSDGEARAVLQALITSRNRQWQSIIVEGDCLQIMEALRNKAHSLRSYGAILEECFIEARFFSFCNFSFVKRRGNSLAHELASISVSDCSEGTILPSHLANSA